MNTANQRPQKIFVSGAGGFVGQELCRALVGRYEVLGLCRREDQARSLRSMGVKVVQSSLEQLSAREIQGAHVVIHAAALGAVWATQDEFERTNVVATKRLLSLAKEVHVQRFIFIGSEAAIFDGRALRDADERTPIPERSPYLYGESKARAERLVLNANTPGFTTLSIRPRLVWGPNDPRLKTLKRSIASGLFAWIGAGRTLGSTTHIRNLIEGVNCALTRGIGGEAYFVTDGEIWTNRKFLTEYLKTQDLSAPNLSLPSWLARLLVRIQDWLWKLAGLRRAPPLPRMATDMMSVDCTVSISKAQRDLGYKPIVTIEEGLSQMPRSES